MTSKRTNWMQIKAVLTILMVFATCAASSQAHPSNSAIPTANAAGATLTIASQPVNQTVTAGQTATFTAVASSPYCRTIILKNGAQIAYGPMTGSDGKVSYTTPILTLADNGELYSFEFYGCGGDVNSKQAVLTVVAGTGSPTGNPAPGAPTITSQPVNQTVTAGQTATFTAVASIPYCRTIIFKNGVQIAYGPMTGSDGKVSYTTPALTLADNGESYSFQFYGCGGTANTNQAVLTVVASVGAPTIITQPSSLTVASGQAATFTVVASGTAPFSYQWQKNGAAISSATAASYTTPATTTANNGSTFNVSITNSAGSVTSASAILTVNAAAVAPTVITQPTSLTVASGQTATLAVAASGTAPLSYQWQKNGTAMSGATSASYTTPATTSADNGDVFQVIVSNSIGTITSNSATLTVTSASGPTVAVNWTDVHQTIEGFGAAVAFQSGNHWTTAETDLLYCNSPVVAPCQQAGAGLSLVRCKIEPDGTFRYVTQLQDAIARGARAWCTPWTATAAYKSNGNENNGGYLLAADYQNWATYLSNYVNTLKNTYGIPLYAISVQNEPDFTASYQSMLYTSQNFHDFILNNLGPTIHASNPGVKIIMPEQSHWQFNLAAATLADPSAYGYVNVVAAHSYFDNATAQSLPAGIELWETEDSDLSPPNDPSMSNALGWAVKIHNYLTIANLNAWGWWWGVDSVDCTGQGLINDSNSGAPCTGTVVAKRLWITGNFSRFVRPGYVRIGATGNPVSGVYVSSYKDPVSGNFAIVVVNQSTSAQTLTYSLSGFPTVSSVTPWVTSSSLDLAQQSSIPVGSNTFTATVSASSVTTFVAP